MADSLLWTTASNGRVLTENGDLVAVFADQGIASAIVEDHNMEVEIEADNTPEIIKSREQRNAERVEAWKLEDPDGARPVRLLSENVARMARLLSLKAPAIILGDCARRIHDMAGSLASLFPSLMDEDV